MLLDEPELDPDSHLWVGAWSAVAIVVLTMFFDIVGEKINGCLMAASGEQEEKKEVCFDRAYGRFVLSLWRRFRAEVTALGFLAFTVFCFSEAKFYHAVTKASKDIYPPEERAREGDAKAEGDATAVGDAKTEGSEAKTDGEGAAERRLLETATEMATGMASSASHVVLAALAAPARQLIATAGRVLEEAASDAPKLDEGGGDAVALHHLPYCKRYMSSSPTYLKELVEAVHYSFFIAMCLYFISLWLACTVHHHRFRRTCGQTKGFERRIAFLLSKGAEWPQTKALIESDTQVAALVQSHRLCYATYIHLAADEFIGHLIEFAWPTWLVALAHAVLQAILSLQASAAAAPPSTAAVHRHLEPMPSGNHGFAICPRCICTVHSSPAFAHWHHITPQGCLVEEHIRRIFQYGFLAIYCYNALRCTIFFCLIRGGASPWPLECLDRYVMWPLGPCATGHAPHWVRPKRKVAVIVQQAWMWFQLQRIAFAVCDTSSSLYKDKGELEISLHNAVVHDLTFVSTVLLLTAIFSSPFGIEMYSLPPLLDEAEADAHLAKALTISKNMCWKGGEGDATAAAVSSSAVPVQLDVQVRE